MGLQYLPLDILSIPPPRFNVLATAEALTDGPDEGVMLVHRVHCSMPCIPKCEGALYYQLYMRRVEDKRETSPEVETQKGLFHRNYLKTVDQVHIRVNRVSSTV